MLEGEHHVDLMVGRISRPAGGFNRRAGHLANREQVPRVQTHFSVHFGEELIEPRTIGGERKHDT